MTVISILKNLEKKKIQLEEQKLKDAYKEKDLIKLKMLFDSIHFQINDAVAEGVEPSEIAATLLIMSFNAAEASFGDLEEEDRKQKIKILKEYLANLALNKL